MYLQRARGVAQCVKMELLNASAGVSSTPLPVTNSSIAACVNFSKDIRVFAHVARPTIAAAGAFASLLVIFIVAFVLKELKKFGYRLVVYFMISTFSVGLAQSLGVLPLDQNSDAVHVKDGWGGACAFIGFSDEVTALMEHIMIAWITVFLLQLVIQRPYEHKKKYEAVGLVAWLGIPLLIGWLPFLNHVYGLAGLWCWISITNETCSEKYVAGIVYQFAIYYVPFTILVIFNTVSFFAIGMFLCKRCLNSRYHSSDSNSSSGGRLTTAHRSSISAGLTTTHRHILRQALPLIFYPIVYNLLLVVQLTNRIYYAIASHRNEEPDHGLWIAQVIVDSSRVVYPPVAFLLHPGTVRGVYKTVMNRRSSQADQETTAVQTAFVVPHEFSDEFTGSDSERLIITGKMEKKAEMSEFSATYLSVNSRS